MTTSPMFRLFSSLEAAGDIFHTGACSSIRVAEFPADAGPISWSAWYPLTTDINTILAHYAADAVLLVQGKRGDKPCRIRPPYGAIVVAPTSALVTKTTATGIVNAYQGPIAALVGTPVDDESKLLLDEEEPTAEEPTATVAQAAPVQVQTAQTAPAPEPAPADTKAPDTAALRDAAQQAAASSARRPGRPKGSPNKAAHPAPDDGAAPAADTVRAIAQIQADLDANRLTVEKLNADAAAAAAALTATTTQIASALKGQAGLLGELEAATTAQRAAADRARAALTALL